MKHPLHNAFLQAILLVGAAAASHAAAAAPAPGFGVAAAVRGEVTVTPAGGGAAQPLRGGQVVSPGDHIHTGPGAGLQVLLTDETVFSIGEQARFSLERYDYDASDASGQIHASMRQGTVKVTSGRVGEAGPDRITLDLPTGKVALRGTVVAARASADGDTVALLGPGARRESLEKKGSFVFIPKGAAVRTGEDEILVYRAGYAVTVDSAGNVSDPVPMTGREFGQLVASLSGYRRPAAGAPPADGEYGEDDSSPYHGRKHRQRRGHDDDDHLAGTGHDDDDDDGDDKYVEYDDEDKVGRFLRDDDFVEGLPLTRLSDLKDVEGMKGRIVEKGLKMEEGGTFDFMFAFGFAAPGELDFVGFKNIQTVDVAGGELSWDVATDGAPVLKNDEMDFRSDEGTLLAKAACTGVCEGRVRVRNAGNGAVAKFFRLRLETGEDKFDERLKPRQGGNNNFPVDPLP